MPWRGQELDANQLHQPHKPLLDLWNAPDARIVQDDVAPEGEVIVCIDQGVKGHDLQPDAVL